MSKDTIACIRIGALILWCVVFYWWMQLAEYVVHEELEEAVRLKKERDEGTGPWAAYPLVQRLKQMEGYYPTPEHPMESWTREEALDVCTRLGHLHRYPNNAPAGDALACSEFTQGCAVRLWYLSQGGQ